MIYREQVLIVSSQPIPNLIPVLKWHPEVVHLLVSEKMTPQAIRIERFLATLHVQVQTHRIDPYDQGQVEIVCREIIADKEAGRVLLNATGGTKVAAFAALETFKSFGFPAVYFDPERWQIIHLLPRDCEPDLPEVELSVTSYLAVYGMNVRTAEGCNDALLKRLPTSRFLARELPSRPGLMRIINGIAAKSVNRGIFPISEKIEPFPKGLIPILSRLQREELLDWNPETRVVTFPGMETSRYLNGFWLEEYVYGILKDLEADDVLRNVEVEWDGTGKKPVQNEFDVVFTRNARLYLVSCKTASLSRDRETLDKNPLYELYSLKESAAGLFGKGVLVSACPMSEALKKRAAASGIEYLEGTDLPYLRDKLLALLNQ